MKILIPMAGEGSRFTQAGYTFPKPLIDVHGKPMIQRVVENLDFDDAEYIFLVRDEHLQDYSIESMLVQITGGRAKIININSLTAGAASTALFAKEFIDNDEELLIANSDQLVDYSVENFMTFRRCGFALKIDGFVFTFHAGHPKWSYVKLNEVGVITEVAEKRPISNVATCGIYYYNQGRTFVKCAEQMIRKNIRVNNEFYIAPVYNELIKQGGTILPFFVNKMYGLGTPEDLETYLKRS